MPFDMAVEEPDAWGGGVLAERYGRGWMGR